MEHTTTPPTTESLLKRIGELENKVRSMATFIAENHPTGEIRAMANKELAALPQSPMTDDEEKAHHERCSIDVSERE